MNLRAATEADVDNVLTLIVEQQNRPERNIPYLGNDAEGIRAELSSLEQPWATTAHVLHDADGALIGTAHGEGDEELGRVWVQGPWVVLDDDRWAEPAELLLDAVLTTVPPATRSEVELLGDVANVLLADLAARRGMGRGITNYALEITSPLAAATSTATLRPASAADLAAIQSLHDAEFPGTYHSARQVLDRAATGEQTVLCAEGDHGTVVGYAAGQVNGDGEGYIDFVAVVCLVVQSPGVRPARCTPSLASGSTQPSWGTEVECCDMAFPGHAGRGWPLLRWRSVARVGAKLNA